MGIAAGFEYDPSTMTGEHLEAILKVAGAKADKDGWHTLPEGNAMTLHVAHDGASMTVSRIEADQARRGARLRAQPQRELFAVARGDVFAVALEGERARARSSGAPASAEI